MEQAPAPEGLPPSLRFLKGLVIALMITMIVAVITVVAVIVTRMPQSFVSQPAALPQLPSAITLPEGTKAQAATFGEGWIAIVTDDNRMLIYSTQGSLQQEVTLLTR
ncbi:hypothetical protein EOK75_04655 [Pseudorhodobacter turbinis]|uniref:Uncharacterized protein n=1 Tax=Pseudorhodobacter turbinis TaxID=2500533 RepID=A0A4P8EEF6_9RHOB|nr:DUF6476 family protein [Pseudorhodobacter turbinis]QCO55127.1 hypothetical protein EOK75_04655 [Pseudorhodobacter turbinis]